MYIHRGSERLGGHRSHRILAETRDFLPLFRSVRDNVNCVGSLWLHVMRESRRVVNTCKLRVDEIAQIKL